MYNHTSIPGNHEHHPTNDDPVSPLPLFLFVLSHLLPTVESPFTEKVQRTKDAINICLTHVQGDLDFISSIPPQSDVHTARALDSCVMLYKDVVDYFRNALAFLDQLGTLDIPSFLPKIKDANLHLSAADTDALTCQERFDIVKIGLSRPKCPIGWRIQVSLPAMRFRSLLDFVRERHRDCKALTLIAKVEIVN